MRLQSSRVIASLVLFLAACGGEDTTINAQHQAIIGGSDDAQHPAVGLLVHDDPDPANDSVCSATLIEPQIVLTAAHCVTTRSAPYQKLDPMYFFVGAGASLDPSTGVPQGSMFLVADIELPSGYSGAASADIAVVRLASAVSASVAEPMSLGASEPSSKQDVTIVGFGMAKEGDKGTVGTRRQATSRISKVRSTTFDLPGASSSQGGSCGGDSGGPVLDDEDRVVGVQAAVIGSCAGGSRHMRVDAYHDWLMGAISKLLGNESEDSGELAGPLEAEPSGYGATCDVSSDCASDVCITVSGLFSSYDVCSQYCDPDANDCPNGDRCDSGANVCVPPKGGERSTYQAKAEVKPDQTVTGGCSVALAAPAADGWMLLVLALVGLGLVRRRRGR